MVSTAAAIFHSSVAAVTPGGPKLPPACTAAEFVPIVLVPSFRPLFKSATSAQEVPS